MWRVGPSGFLAEGTTTTRRPAPGRALEAFVPWAEARTLTWDARTEVAVGAES
jgi:hypothetical protein